MASIVSVEQLKGLASGSTPNTISIPAGQTLHAPGHVIQVVRGVIPTSSETFTSTSYAASSLYVTITPKFSTSSMVIMASVNMDYGSGTNATLAIYKDGSIVTPQGSSPYDGHAYYNRISNSRIITQQPIMAYDSSVGTTSAVTYKMYVKTHSGNVDVRHDLAVENIVAMEIAQ